MMNRPHPLFLLLLLCCAACLLLACSDTTTTKDSDTHTPYTTRVPDSTSPAVTTAVTTTTTTAIATTVKGPDLVLPDINDTNGLMWYEFNEAENATVLKSSLSQPRDSILFAGTIGKEGGSYAVFSNENDGIKLNNTFTDFSQITDSTFLHPAQEALSVSFSILPDSLSGEQMLFEYGSQYRGFAIAIADGMLVASITASDSDAADGTQKRLTPYPLPETVCHTWTSIAFSFDGTLDGGTVTLYVNGLTVATLTDVGRYLPQVLDASGVATAAHGSNSLLMTDAPYRGGLDDLRIYQIAFTHIPALEEGVIYLQSAAYKNHYIKASASSLAVAAMVEPSLRGIIIEKGLADTAGVSLRMSGTNRYIAYLDGTLIAAEIPREEDKKLATFYQEEALARPGWGVDKPDAFISLRLMDSNRYLAADSGTLALITPSDATEKLSASFCLTGDQTAVIENLRGAVYYPSYALNAPQFFKWYDSAIIERDMQYAKTLGINAFRIWVSYEYWLENPDHFKASYDDFLTLADEYGIKIMVSLFEGCGKAEEGYYSENVWSRDYTKAWSITSPCKEIYTNQNRWDEPKAFVTWFFKTYGNDTRHMAIEIYNEPWGNREALAKYLSEYAVTMQGSVPITFGTAPAGGYNIVYSVEAGADMLHYHDNFPASADAFYKNAMTRIEQGRLSNLPVYCTEIQWVGGPATVNYPLYRNLAPTVNLLSETKVWAPFYWTLMVHPCYLDSYRNNYKMKNGLIQEDGSYYSYGDISAIAPEMDFSDAKINNHNPYDDKAYTYRYLFSDDFSDKNAYKWQTVNGTWSAAQGYYAGQGTAIANATAFADFSAAFSVSFEEEAGFVFRYQDAENYYLATVSETAYSLYKVVNGEKTLLASKTPEEAGKSFTVTVYAKGNELRLSANCTDCTATDPTFQCGAFGFYANQTAAFDALRVTYLAQ
ncbi:MAG: cellulase family glycosylhydrolase [Clostridia bacterium]|nr:cellulase family glycosylhydrolase [Clostridia bacterium]